MSGWVLSSNCDRLQLSIPDVGCLIVRFDRFHTHKLGKLSRLRLPLAMMLAIYEVRHATVMLQLPTDNSCCNHYQIFSEPESLRILILMSGESTYTYTMY